MYVTPRIAVNMVYYGLSQNSGNLGGNIFVNFIALMLIEIPSYICVAIIFDRLEYLTIVSAWRGLFLVRAM